MNIRGSLRTREGGALVTTCIVMLDAALVWIAGAVSNRLMFGHWDTAVGQAGVMLAAAALMAMISSAVYRTFRGGALMAMLGRVVLAWTIVWAIMIIWIKLVEPSGLELPPNLFVTWGLLGLVALVIGRGLTVVFLRWVRSQGYNERQVLLIGDGPVTQQLRTRIDRAAWTGYQVVGIVEPAQAGEIEARASGAKVHEIWINLRLDQMGHMPRIMEALRHSPSEIRMVPDVFTYRMLNHGTTSIAGVPMIDISASPLHGLAMMVKRAEDYVLASLILLLISPLLVVISLLVKLTSRGPVLYKQLRHGWNGEEILVYKFRTMHVHQEQKGVVTQAKRNDPRLTPIGGFLRRTSLDELPQFINVLQGRMSIVGPRPHALEHNYHYRELIPHYMLRHKVKPGITGWAQINGFRGETETVDKMKARVEFDLHYLERWSLWLDLRIVFKTLFKGFFDKNAY